MKQKVGIGIFGSVLALQLIAAFTQLNFWPISSYPMYSSRIPEAQVRRYEAKIFDRRGQELDLDLNKWEQTRLSVFLYRLMREPSSSAIEDRIRKIMGLDYSKEVKVLSTRCARSQADLCQKETQLVHVFQARE